MKKLPVFFSLLILTITVLLGFISKNDDSDKDWAEYLGGGDRNHYSTLTQINPENVTKLQVAWVYSTPDSGLWRPPQKLGKYQQRRDLLGKRKRQAYFIYSRL